MEISGGGEKACRIRVFRGLASVTREDCIDQDDADETAPLREQFALPDGVVYLDGNSLGPLPGTAADRVAQVVGDEWGEGLIRSWNAAGWIDLPRRIGDKIGQLIGAGPGETIVADSTSVDLYKALHAALDLVPGRAVVLTEPDNFPTDLYIAQSVVRERGLELRLRPAAELAAGLDDQVAVLLLTQVNYRTGRLHAMGPINRAAHDAGALTVWDLSHSAGVVPLDVRADGADFAVGCGYKYLNGGPGAPAFLWADPRHTARMDAAAMRQPLAGWLGHAAPFAFEPEYRPAPGIARFACGTPPILSLAALECGVDTVLAAQAYGGMAALRAKAIALTELFIALAETRCAGHGLVARDAARRRRAGQPGQLRLRARRATRSCRR